MDLAHAFHIRLCSGVIDFRVCWRVHELRPVWYCNLDGRGHWGESIHRLEEAQIESRLNPAKSLFGLADKFPCILLRNSTCPEARSLSNGKASRKVQTGDADDRYLGGFAICLCGNRK